MRICVIGAGPSGLCAAKEIRENNAGFELTILEASSALGGAFANSYKGLTLVNNPLLVSFSDFLAAERIDDLRMWTAEEYVRYLHRYAEAHDLLPCIRYRSKVRKARLADGRWQVEVSDDAGRHTRVFDRLVVCSGANGRPNLPAAGELAGYTGRVVHSSDIRDPAELENQRVVFIGMGETGSDLCHFVSAHARSCAVSIRRCPGYLIARYHDGRPTDLDTSRIHHSLPKLIEAGPLGCLLRLKRRIERRAIRSSDDAAIQDLADRMNGSFANTRGLGPFRRISTKSCGFMRAHLSGKVQIKPGIIGAEGLRLRFDDGTAAVVDVVVCCTGFRHCLDFLPPRLASRLRSSNGLYDYMFVPEYGEKLALVGFVRPAVGTVPVLAEMQSRYLALLYAGHVSLPSPDAMDASITAQQRHARQLFPLDFARVGHLVDYYPYMAGLAAKIGVLPRLWTLFFTEPLLWYKVNFSFLCPGMFRLHGPGARRDQVRPVLRALPTMPAAVLAIEALLYALCRLLSLIGLRRFRPSA